MNVRVKLFGLFRTNLFKEAIRSYPSGVSAGEIFDDLELPAHLLGIIVINDKHASGTDILHDGDTLAFLPLLDGG